MARINPAIFIIVGILLFFNLYNFRNGRDEAESQIRIENNTIYLEDFTLKQKISQMFIVRADERNLESFYAGGILVAGLKTKEQYAERIKKYKEKSKIKLFVAADLEGWWNPFSDFVKFPNLDEIKTKEEAYNLGKEHGKLLKELGFNLNFAPVAELEDNVWKHRAFTGNASEISEKVNSYIQGLQKEGVMATLKHYPGGSLNRKDPHLYVVKSEISEEQLEVFESALENVSAVMVGHAIVSGAADSKGMPSSVSGELISELRKKFDSLIISDDASMRGLRNMYFFNERQLFIDLINAGNDIIIDASSWNFYYNYNFKKRIAYIEEAVKSGEISMARIDESVRRILKAKGYNAV